MKRARDFTERTLRRAKDVIGVHAYQISGGAPHTWVWSLTPDPNAEQKARPAKLEVQEGIFSHPVPERPLSK